ncbi:MAG: hypothetical protein QM736_05930 [Vicinamibacterales bacterium]
MKKRPVSITVVGWFLMVTSVISLFSTLVALRNAQVHELMAQVSIPLPVQFAMMFVGLGVNGTCGFCLLRAQRWARILYVGWSVVGLLVGVLTSPMRWALVPGAVVFVVITVLLFLPNANAYFARQSDTDAPNP